MSMTRFLRDETGAVTIDWVALTAGILLLGIMVVYAVFNDGVGPLLTTITDSLQGANVVTNDDIGTKPDLNTGGGGTGTTTPPVDGGTGG